jgi:prepilin-type N-terminal cleavage/methylation domain-containing protein
MARNDRGFTLLEILVVLVVCGLLFAGLAQTLGFTLRAWGTQGAMIERDGDLDAVDRTLRGLIVRMELGDPRSETAPLVGNARSMLFLTELPIGSGALATREVDAALRVEGDHRLVLRWVPHYRTLLGVPPRVTDTDLLRNVDHIELSYWPRRDGTRWLAGWDERELPALVRIRIVFRQGDARQWPDIVAAPMQEMT